MPSSISLQYDVSFLKSESPTGSEGRISEGHIPGSSGPETFWRVLDGETGLSKVVFDAESGDINGLFAVSPSGRTTMAYMSDDASAVGEVENGKAYAVIIFPENFTKTAYTGATNPSSNQSTQIIIRADESVVNIKNAIFSTVGDAATKTMLTP